MFNTILRERRQRKWSAKRKAMDRKTKLEQQLEKLEKRIEPDHWKNEDGILVGIHSCRGRYRRPEFRFEFYRKDPLRGRVADFGEADLDALIEAIEAVKLSLSQV